MSARIEFPKLADGFQLGSIHIHCTTWEAYDSLSAADGWRELRAERIDRTFHCWKSLDDGWGGYVAVYPPHEPRPDVTG